MAMWEGKVTAAISGVSPDLAWSYLGDFCGLHRWVPSVHTCHKLEGTDGEPGCVRYCAGPVNKRDPTAFFGWSTERLTRFDPVGRSYDYEIVENNKGFRRYRATFAVAPDTGGSPDRCRIEWSFAADPIEGWSRDGFLERLQKLAEGVAARVQEEIGRCNNAADQ